MEIIGVELPDFIPSFGIGTGKIVIILVSLLIIILAAFIIYFVFIWRIYNKKIIVFENVAGQGYQPNYRDKARIVSLGDSGEELLFLRKAKKYRTAYGRKMGKNTYWFAIGQDGYWYNVILGDIDAKMGMLDIEPIDRDMRYMHVAVRKNIQDRYRKKSLEKATAIAIAGIVIAALILVIGVWFLLDKIAETADKTNENIKASQEVVVAAADIVSSLDNIYSRGGIREVG